MNKWLELIYQRLACICTSLLSPLQLASRTLVVADGSITLASMTGDSPARALVFHLPAGQQIQLSDPDEMTTAVFDNTDGAGAITLSFGPGFSIPADWTLLASTASAAQISVFY